MLVPAWVIIPRVCGFPLKSLLYQSSFLAVFYIPILFATTNVDELLDKGTQLLASGRLDDALSLYQQAAQEYPDNHLVYYKRGTAYLAVGNFRSAFNDFDKSIQLNSEYSPATKQRAKLHLKLGNLKEAIQDYELLEPTDNEAKLGKVEAQQLQESLKQANDLYDSKKYAAALPILDKLTDAMKYNDQLREMRALCLLNLGEIQKGIQELRFAVHLTNDNREGLLRVSKLMYDSGFAIQSLEEIRDCLKLDPDHQGCFQFYKMVRKVAKAIVDAQDSMESEKYSDCIASANNILKFEPDKPEYKHQAEVLLCQCHAKSKSADGISYCESIVQRHPENIDYLLYKAESYSNADRFEEAISTYQKVMDKEPRNRQAQEGVKKNQQLLKASKRRNYYKILGVSKSASKKEILKAYRKLAAEHHPDNADENNKQKAQAKFLEIAAAKEVLADDEKRALYDSGVDPLDPEQQQGQGPFGHPFGGFSFANMHPFDGAHFEFHFG